MTDSSKEKIPIVIFKMSKNKCLRFGTSYGSRIESFLPGEIAIDPERRLNLSGLQPNSLVVHNGLLSEYRNYQIFSDSIVKITPLRMKNITRIMEIINGPDSLQNPFNPEGAKVNCKNYYIIWSDCVRKGLIELEYWDILAYYVLKFPHLSNIIMCGEANKSLLLESLESYFQDMGIVCRNIIKDNYLKLLQRHYCQKFAKKMEDKTEIQTVPKPGLISRITNYLKPAS